MPGDPAPGSMDPDAYRQGEGVIYAKVSPAGKKSEIPMDFSRFTEPQQPFMAVRDDTAHHYALIHVAAAGRVSVEVFRVAGDGTPKSLLDAFTLSV